MIISDAARVRQRAGFDAAARRAGLCALAVALAGCAQPGTSPGAGAAGAARPAMTVPGLGSLQIPQIQWPRTAAGGTAGGAAGTTAKPGATGRITDPFAGQGVRQNAAAAPTPAAPTPAASAGSGTAGAARAHVVAAGETAWSVARRYGVSVQDLARANALPETMSLRVGQRLTIPQGSAAPGGVAVVVAPGVGSATPRPPSSAQPLPTEKTAPASAPPPKTPAPNLGGTRTAASGSGKLAMPASGAIARTYKKGTNEGIDIAAPPGTPIKAAGSGTVAAVTRDTDGVPIVVVRHPDGLMTVYAGVDKLSVSKGDSVSRGQSIGAARSSGILHFEVRNGFDSVDPENYL